MISNSLLIDLCLILKLPPEQHSITICRQVTLLVEIYGSAFIAKLESLLSAYKTAETTTRSNALKGKGGLKKLGSIEWFEGTVDGAIDSSKADIKAGLILLLNVQHLLPATQTYSGSFNIDRA